MTTERSTLALAFAFAVAGCSSGTSPKTGLLTLTVNGPTGLVGAVTITGANGYHQTIGSTQRLALAAGSYTITAANVLTSDSIVGTLYIPSITGSPAIVSVGADTTATVTYRSRAGTGGLWIAGGFPFGSGTFNMAIEIPEFALKSSGQAVVGAKLGFGFKPGTQTIDDANLAFDSAGNLWVVNNFENTVVEYPVSELATSTSNAMPAVTINLPGQGTPFDLAFDANGNLWVANAGGNVIWELAAAQLMASGSPTPAVTITSTTGPGGLAFDARGNLWVSHTYAGNLIEYASSQLAQGGALAPAVEITGPLLQSPTFLAFDKSGNLWVPTDAGKILEYSASSLSASGSPAPALTLTPPSGANAAMPAGIAFDESGNLWYADLFNSVIGEYTAAQLAAGGSPLPTVMITNSANLAGEGIAFDPHPAAVPLH